MKAINFLNQGKQALHLLIQAWPLLFSPHTTLISFVYLCRYQRTVQHLSARAAEQTLLVCLSGLH